MLEFKVKEVDWATAQAPISAIRRAVFIEEQGVPEDLEWDGCDADARHVLAWIGDQAIATGRLLPSGHIGRMAVMPGFRGQGMGRAVLEALLKLAQRAALSQVFLNAQVRAREFYAKQGFTQSGETFLDAGIPHVHMQRDLVQPPIGMGIEPKPNVEN